MCTCTSMRQMLPYATFYFILMRWPHLTQARHGITQTTPATCSKTVFPPLKRQIPLPLIPSIRPSDSTYQIPGTIANFFALYLPPNSFLYLRSFFLAQTAICPTAIAMNSAVLQCLLTIKIAIQAIDSKV
jgi:hypothetical protein